MKRQLLLFVLLFFSCRTIAQIAAPSVTSVLSYFVLPPEIHFDFSSEEDNRLIRENDTLKYYVASGDSTNVVSINEEASYYKLFNRAHKLIADGPFVTDGDKYLQDGKWTERYDNGKIKLTGSYLKGQQIGTWQSFYPNGKMQTVYNFGIFMEGSTGDLRSCMSGSYQAYYQSGKAMVEGFFAALLLPVDDTIKITDPVTDALSYKVSKHSVLSPTRVGNWEFYSETGELVKEEEFLELHK